MSLYTFKVTIQTGSDEFWEEVESEGKVDHGLLLEEFKKFLEEDGRWEIKNVNFVSAIIGDS